MSVSTLDRAGITISALCIVHCVLLPVATTALPMLGLLAENETIHKVLVLLAIIPAVFAFTRTLKYKLAFFIRGVALFGILALFAGAFIEAFHDFETMLTVIGGLSLAAAHIWRSLAVRSHLHES